jgi:3-deoxy-D-manno-octulosonate 8-phosphate phosphatase (KDO 8-P phosphatase)
MNVLALFKPIGVFVFDVDGVMTDGTLQVLGNGELSRQMNIKDGYALQLAVKKGYRVAVISGGKSPGVVKRLQGLGITDIFTGVGGKSEVLDAYLAKYAIPPEKILYMGDDMPDLAAMKRVGLPACPADAVPEIKAICRYISFAVGGRGCVRDVIEKVLKLNGHWE